MTAGESQADAASSEITESDLEMPDYVRMLLFNNNGDAILLVRTEGSWDLPYFSYPESLNYCVQICCNDLERLLLLPLCQRVNYFTVMAELYGEIESYGRNDDGAIGFSRLMLTECHLEELPLPPHAAWGGSSCLESLLRDPERSSDSSSCITDVLHYLTDFPSLLSACVDQRYQYGWYDRVVSWFHSELSKAGIDSSNSDVVQEQVIATSTLLKLEIDEQHFYLKAPAVGLNEVPITAKIASLFPDSSPVILATSLELNCFITARFHKVLFSEPQYSNLVSKLAFFQLESLPFLDQLKEAGCDVRDLTRMASVLEEWKEDRDMEGVLKHLFPKYKEYLPRFIQLLNRLDAYNFPLTLVHGDFSYGNAAFKARENEESLILFDWQYACISHPFFDFHEVTVNNDFPEGIIEEYLDLWSKYEPRERAREAFQIACALGWLLKIWTSFDCLKKCNPQKASTFGDIIVDAVNVMVDQIDHPFLEILSTN